MSIVVGVVFALVGAGVGWWAAQSIGGQMPSIDEVPEVGHPDNGTKVAGFSGTWWRAQVTITEGTAMVATQRAGTDRTSSDCDQELRGPFTVRADHDWQVTWHSSTTTANLGCNDIKAGDAVYIVGFTDRDGRHKVTAMADSPRSIELGEQWVPWAVTAVGALFLGGLAGGLTKRFGRDR